MLLFDLVPPAKRWLTRFAMGETEDQAVVEQIVQSAEPVDPEKPVTVEGVTREVIAPPASTPSIST